MKAETEIESSSGGRETREIDSPRRALFPGKITVIDTPEALEDAYPLIRREPLLGFDTESKPKFTKGGVPHPVALMQLASLREAWLIRTYQLGGLLDPLKALIADAHILKVGLSLHDDLQRLDLSLGSSACGFVDLQQLARAKGLERNSLRYLVGQILGLRLSKGAQLSNWEQDTLSQSQVNYASTDAWVSLLIYLAPLFADLRGEDLWPASPFRLGMPKRRKSKQRQSGTPEGLV